MPNGEIYPLISESQFDYFYSDGFGSAFDDQADADLGIFVSRNGAATTCTQGTKLNGLPTTVVTCGDGEVCQDLVGYHTHPNGQAKAHYHSKLNYKLCSLLKQQLDCNFS